MAVTKKIGLNKSLGRRMYVRSGFAMALMHGGGRAGSDCKGQLLKSR